jgi:hypothetical protein
MNPEEIESNVKRIVGDEIKKSQNDFLSQMDNKREDNQFPLH